MAQTNRRRDFFFPPIALACSPQAPAASPISISTHFCIEDHPKAWLRHTLVAVPELAAPKETA